MKASEHKALLARLTAACEALGDTTRHGPYFAPTDLQASRMQHAVSEIRAAIAFVVNH